MRLPFSYKHSGPSFNALLFTSFLGHAVIFGSGGLLGTLSPRFSVQEAPSSVEVVILKQRPEKEEKVPELRILSVKEPSPDSPPIFQREEKKPREKKVEESVVTPEEKGALEAMKLPYLKNPPPVYPARAREEGWEGLVILNVLVSADGTPRQIEVLKSSNYGILDEAAVKAVWKWQFLAARAGRISFSSRIKIPIRFRLIEA